MKMKLKWEKVSDERKEKGGNRKSGGISSKL